MASAYFFKAVASDGKVRTGTLTADSERSVASELRRQGLIPVQVSANSGKNAKTTGFKLSLPALDRGKRRDVLFFTGEISTLLNAGVPLDRALSITAELTERTSFRALMTDVLRILKGGKSLADSLAAHPTHFSELYINMVRAGEASGSLALIFERLAEFERTRDDLRAYIVSSMIYPILLSCVGIASVFILLNFVVPRFAAIFSDPHLKIPAPTLLMMQASQIVQDWWIPFTVVMTLVSAAFYTYIKTTAGRLWWDTFRLRIPLLGDSIRKAETSRFARAMGTLVSSSVPLVSAIGIARGILSNQRMAGSLEAVSQGVKRGEGIATPLQRTGAFPALAGHLLAVGEETGRLDTMFYRMADIYENETRTAIRRFTSLFEPLIILTMGILIGSLILSLLLAITSINDVNI